MLIHLMLVTLPSFLSRRNLAIATGEICIHPVNNGIQLPTSTGDFYGQISEPSKTGITPVQSHPSNPNEKKIDWLTDRSRLSSPSRTKKLVKLEVTDGPYVQGHKLSMFDWTPTTAHRWGEVEGEGGWMMSQKEIGFSDPFFFHLEKNKCSNNFWGKKDSSAPFAKENQSSKSPFLLVPC